MPDISVIICTHNPRTDYVSRTLEALKTQTLPPEQWELLLIDNASTEPLAKIWDLSWHLNARHVHEGELGLTPARLRGIEEAKGDTLVFVDDDNVLAPDYLAESEVISENHPFLGSWGAGVGLAARARADALIPKDPVAVFCQDLLECAQHSRK